MIKIVSYGGGIQSTALLVLAAEHTIDYQTFVFANVGDDSEHPATLEYIEQIAKPYAAEHGIQIHELRHTRRDGEEETIYKKLTRPGTRSTCIPIYLEGSGAPGRRSCTSDFKIRRIAIWLHRHGATKDDPATVALGISTDEFQRARTDSSDPTQKVVYPLLDLRLSRNDCRRIIEQAGLPVPPKSSCWFCPFHSMATWHELKRTQPALFERAVELEHTLSDRSDSVPGRGKVFLTRKLRPLDQVIGDQSSFDFLDDMCESGYCHT
jgi:3'-phosphoadenosine 5'-phosphosulfate sulfotransferase (PAPS reductase)/FAD synthetase